MLTGKVIFVTGGNGLLGRELLRSIAEQGGTAINADLSPPEKPTPSDRITFVQTNITDRASVSGAIASVFAEHGKIDALVNCAYPRNAAYGTAFWDLSYEDFCGNLDLHLGGYFLTSQQFAHFFRRQGHGNIITVSSIYGVVPPRFEIYAGTSMTNPIEYGVIKSGLIHMTKYLAASFKGLNIRANCISPGGIRNGQPEAFLEKYRAECLNKGMLDPKDLMGAFSFLLSDASQFVNGQNIVVDDGFTL